MKYNELIKFEPINEVIKFERLSSDDYRRSLVKDFVFSQSYEKAIIPEICRNLDYTASYETFGLQIVGNYGTGKSHLMSLFSIIAEDADYLPLVQNDSARKVLGNIAGKYKLIRFELGSDDELWRLVGYQIDKKFKEWGIDYSIVSDTTPDMYADKLRRMMSQFEEKFPDKGLMIVIDEMLSYLKGRSGNDKLNRDLSVLQALGQSSDHSKFRMVFGAQELIYTAPEFAFAADMLKRVEHRFRLLPISKQDVKFVVQKRLLSKNDSQRDLIRRHLQRFTEFFTDMHANLEEYVNLFPVNPSFFENFQQIKIGKSQREILKTLSSKFNDIYNNEVPEDEPGLICYDSYWADLQTPQMQVYPDIQRITEIMTIIYQKIDENFTGVRAKMAPLAYRIVNACALKILQDSLTKTNGISVENLVDDLCYLDSGCYDRDLLIDVVNLAASQIVTATVGQHFEKNNTNQEYHLRIEGGVNYEQKIKDFATTLSEDNKDSHFFNYLYEYLPIGVNPYRREFKIYNHLINWYSHKTKLDGYIFMGNPNERSTTQPQQNFYIYFMPIFNLANTTHGNEADSVYVHFEKASDELKRLFELYAATESLIKSADSSQKPIYEQFKKKYIDQIKPIFHNEFLEKAEIVYMGEVQTVNLSGKIGQSKEEIISDATSHILEDYFCSQMPDYPKFSLLKESLTPDNRYTLLKAARQKIVNPTQPNRDGEAILAGLGLLKDNQLSIEGSIYAQSIKQRLENKGEGQVLNRDEILHRFYKDWANDWRSNDYGLQADLEFLVLATMVAVGEIEIDLPGKNINATNLREIIDLPADAFYNFSHIRSPKGINLALVRKIFMAVVGRDLTAQLGNAETYIELTNKASKIAASAVKLKHELGMGIYLEDVPIITETDAISLRNRLDALSGFCDRLQTYNSQPRLSNLPPQWTVESLQSTFDTIPLIFQTRRILNFVEDFRQRLSYLNQATQYMTSDQMKAEVEGAIKQVADIVACMNDEAKVNAYRLRLDSLMGKYADWYISEYNRLHINGLEDSQKRRIIQSQENKICEAIFSADHDKGYFSQAAQYTDWMRRINMLQMGSTINRDAVLRTPYMGFNPLKFKGIQLPKLANLEDELKDIHLHVDEALHAILKDPKLVANKDILDDSEQALLKRFNNGDEELTPVNAERLVEIAAKLHRGIQKICVSSNDLRNVFNRPMTPDDAIKAFRTYINSLTTGTKDASNIRIIFK